MSITIVLNLLSLDEQTNYNLVLLRALQVALQVKQL